MVAGPRRRSRAFKAECREVQFIDEDVDHPDRVLRANIVVDAVRQKQRLAPLATFDETAHSTPPALPKR
ncbi:hypothetical protein MMMDOFMJ_4644 [Methylobacterium gnaphalii]|nr:hypothetical protein MMMDOFMJ_4644 [Methylobacterium gnaphalii]